MILEGENVIINNAFGGGNQAATGDEQSNNSTSNVKIVGGKIGKNVYGGANTSVVYGITNVKIGYDAVEDTTLNKANVEIEGTVFGGGEANASGSEDYDFDFTSVTNGIDILIDGNGHNILSIKGSIFGSGNASNTSGESNITIKNYGTADNPQSNVSIQRTNCAKIINSALSLLGAKDRTNEFSNTSFSISRVDEVKLVNGSILYLCNGVNLLTKVYSILEQNGIETKGTVTINEETGETIKNVDNRIYMLEGNDKNLTIATNQARTAYGQVSGMFFFGLFTNKNSPSTSTGFYHHGYENGNTIINAGTFSSHAYVMAEHMVDHNTQIDGFYTNYNDDGIIKTDYIGVTPENDVYYVWHIGEETNAREFNFTLSASKYSTLGTYELLLEGFQKENSKFTIVGFSAGLVEGVSLIEPSEIEAVAEDINTANNVYGFSMRSGNSGWQTNGRTNFLTANGGSYLGTSHYNRDNTSYAPTLNFCVYNSKNITIARELGDLRIRMQVMQLLDGLNYDISYVDINVLLISEVHQSNYYEAAITPGQEFGLFTTTDTTITSKSSFSVYYSLYIENFLDNQYNDQYPNAHRVLVSRNANGQICSFPENTKITMLDMATNKYYYYIVSANDVNQNKYEYNFSDFVMMGSGQGSFDELTANQLYRNLEQDSIYENFIFHVNFADTNIQQNIINNSILVELKNEDNQTLIGVHGTQRDTSVYTVYTGQDATINVAAQTDKDTMYLGQNLNLEVTTEFTQEKINSKTIYDTKYFDKKLGVKISIYDNDGNRLGIDSLLGCYFELDGQKYYPRIDGTTRIKIGDKVTNVLAELKLNTGHNKILPTGTYQIKIESFGSSDGIYYGLEASDMDIVEVAIINSSYGLKVLTGDTSKIVDKTTGNLEDGRNSLVTVLNYASSLEQPSIAVSLYRRDYEEQFTQEYNLVDLRDYVSIMLTPTLREKEYLVVNNPASTMNYFLILKPNLVTGTYRLVYKLYDSNNYIGEAYEYIIIK